MTVEAVQEEDGSNRRRDLSHKLTIIARHLRNRFDQNVTKLGVTRSQWTLIAVVSRMPGLTQRTIAERLEISEAAAGRLIDRLCADGILERQARRDDRRAYSVHLTPAAAPYLETLSGVARRMEDETFSGFGEDQLNILEGLLDRVYRNLAVQKEAAAS
jgi:MarR family transcriptional regulator for hemolysin